MTELEQQIVELTKRGLSARKVWGRLDSDLTIDQVAKIAKKLCRSTGQGRKQSRTRDIRDAQALGD